VMNGQIIALIVVFLAAVVVLVVLTMRQRRTRNLKQTFGTEYERAVQAAGKVELMQERGYPVEEFDQRAADISVDHPDLVQSYRAAHEVSTRTGRGTASTDDLPIALQRYRDMFMELLGARERVSSDAAQSERALGHQEMAR
jgi:hypothetical protein